MYENARKTNNNLKKRLICFIIDTKYLTNINVTIFEL